MKRRNIMISVLILTTILALPAILQLSQASSKKSNSEFLRYDFDVVYGQPTILSVDISGAPELVKMEFKSSILDCTVTIDGQVYSYPEDFDIIAYHFTEHNPTTGEGLARAEVSIIFEMLGKPTLKVWGVSRLIDWQTGPDGRIISPENARAEGQFELTGTKVLSQVTGFGIGNTYFETPDYTNLHVRQMGYIEGWKS